MSYLPPESRPYAAAILAVATDNPSAEERLLINALGIDQTEERHVAFAGWCRRKVAGEAADEINHYLDLARAVGELNAAMYALSWLRIQSATNELSIDHSQLAH